MYLSISPSSSLSLFLSLYLSLSLSPSISLFLSVPLSLPLSLYVYLFFSTYTGNVGTVEITHAAEVVHPLNVLFVAFCSLCTSLSFYLCLSLSLSNVRDCKIFMFEPASVVCSSRFCLFFIFRRQGLSRCTVVSRVWCFEVSTKPTRLPECSIQHIILRNIETGMVLGGDNTHHTHR